MFPPLSPRVGGPPEPVYYSLHNQVTPQECLAPTPLWRHLKQAAPPWPAGPENGQRQLLHRLYLKMFTSPQTPPTPITEDDRGGGAWRRHVIGPRALLPRLVSPRRNTKLPTHRKRAPNAPRGDRPGCWVTWLPCPPI